MSRLAPQLFAQQALSHPDRLALQAADGDFSFAELEEASRHLAWRLRRAGAGPEVVVGIVADRDSQLIVSMLAVWRCAAAFILLEPAEPADRAEFKLRQANAALVTGPQRLVEAWQGREWTVVPAQGTTTARPELPQAAAGMLAYVVYTSGSTGRPKGVMIEHGGLAEHLHTQVAPVYERAAKGEAPLRVGGAAPVTFDSFIDQFLPMAALGHTLVLFGEDERKNSQAFLVRELDVVDCAPSQLSVLISQGLLSKATPPRLVVFGGEKPDPHTWQALRASNTLAVSIYGATECTVGSFEVEAHDSDRVTLGRPSGSATAYVLDSRLRPVPPGEPGEIYIGGPGVGRGYAGDPQATAAAFLPDPFSSAQHARLYRTGDLGRVAADGQFEFLGRIDDQIKIRGHRVEPGEVERVVEQLESVRRACVVPVMQAGVASHLVAFVELHGTAVAAGVLEAAKGRLPAYLVPAKVVALPHLPLTHNGKIDRAALSAQAASELRSAGAAEAPATPTEEQVHQVWQEVLGLQQLGVTDLFAEVGGHSLAAVQILVKLQDRVGKVDAGRLLGTRTVREMAAALDGSA